MVWRSHHGHSTPTFKRSRCAKYAEGSKLNPSVNANLVVVDSALAAHAGFKGDMTVSARNFFAVSLLA